MALIELTDSPASRYTQLVICVERSMENSGDCSVLLRDLRWVGFELTTLARWAGSYCETSTRWLMMAMETSGGLEKMKNDS